MSEASASYSGPSWTTSSGAASSSGRPCADHSTHGTSCSRLRVSSDSSRRGPLGGSAASHAGARYSGVSSTDLSPKAPLVRTRVLRVADPLAAAALVLQLEGVLHPVDAGTRDAQHPGAVVPAGEAEPLAREADVLLQPDARQPALGVGQAEDDLAGQHVGHEPGGYGTGRAARGQAVTGLQTRTRSRTDSTPTTSGPSQTTRWRKPPRTIVGGGPLEVPAGLGGDGVGREVVADQLGLGVLPLRDGEQHVALGEDPRSVGVRVEHQGRPDLAGGHLLGGLAQGVGRSDGEHGGRHGVADEHGHLRVGVRTVGPCAPRVQGSGSEDPVHPAVRVRGAAVLQVEQGGAQLRGDRAGLPVAGDGLAAGPAQRRRRG